MPTLSPRTSLHRPARPPSPIAADVARGLTRIPKVLPPYLFYDRIGSALYEDITALDEYYLTRTERAILERFAPEIVARASGGRREALTVVELGAGTAAKTLVLLQAVLRFQGHCTYVPTDVSPTALGEAVRRINRQAPEIVVHPVCATHVDAFGVIARLPPTRFALFIGSSIGNYETRDAEALLRGLRGSLHPGGAFLLGTDLRKSPDILLPAYDDARGVTAAFNKNVLARINRELGGAFDLDTFRHVAVWDEARSRVEMHLESLREQSVHIAELGLAVRFARGERIHTESSIKYDGPMVDTLLGSCGFRRERTFTDPDALFAVHLARA